MKFEVVVCLLSEPLDCYEGCTASLKDYVRAWNPKAKHRPKPWNVIMQAFSAVADLANARDGLKAEPRVAFDFPSMTPVFIFKTNARGETITAQVKHEI